MILYGLSFNSKLFALCPLGRVTAAKRLRFASLKLPSATSCIHSQDVNHWQAKVGSVDRTKDKLHRKAQDTG
ncbi:hypothetical protein C5S36_02910 [Candidatus Methanophagaceae archaeon]|jgi:hypothetical protein|nr:hypothetical protein C5S36_02910 [Methanophagales archaeon]